MKPVYTCGMYPLNDLNKTPRAECLKLHRFAHCWFWNPCSPCGRMPCSSSSCPRQRPSYRSRRRCHCCLHSQPGHEPSPWWYPCESACTCCSGELDEIGWSADPARRSSTPLWKDTIGRLAWSRPGTCSDGKSAEISLNRDKRFKRKNSSDVTLTLSHNF